MNFLKARHNKRKFLKEIDLVKTYTEETKVLNKKYR